MKVRIVKEVKRSDGLWRFACGDVFAFPLLFDQLMKMPVILSPELPQLLRENWCLLKTISLLDRPSIKGSALLQITSNTNTNTNANMNRNTNVNDSHNFTRGTFSELILNILSCTVFWIGTWYIKRCQSFKRKLDYNFQKRSHLLWIEWGISTAQILPCV